MKNLEIRKGIVYFLLIVALASIIGIIINIGNEAITKLLTRVAQIAFGTIIVIIILFPKKKEPKSGGYPRSAYDKGWD